MLAGRRLIARGAPPGIPKLAFRGSRDGATRAADGLGMQAIAGAYPARGPSERAKLRGAGAPPRSGSRRSGPLPASLPKASHAPPPPRRDRGHARTPPRRRENRARVPASWTLWRDARFPPQRSPDMNEHLNPKTLHQPGGVYSHTVHVPANSEWLVIAGQIGIDPQGQLADGIRAQSEQVFHNISPRSTRTACPRKTSSRPTSTSPTRASSASTAPRATRSSATSASGIDAGHHRRPRVARHAGGGRSLGREVARLML